MSEGRRKTQAGLADLARHCEEPNRVVSLPEPVRATLGLRATATRSTYLRAAIARLADRPARQLRSRGGEEVVYQAFLGPFLGFADECGTFSSFICHLPFLLEELEVTTILLLPILRRGKARKKGRTGSPFAIYDHLSIDQGFSDFSHPYGPDEVWELLVSECRRLGVRLGMILPLATLAMDAPAIREEPGIVFWWLADPGELMTGEPQPGSDGDGATARPSLQDEAIPAGEALHRFTAPPRPTAVDVVDRDGSGLYVASDRFGRQISVANAYPDPIVGSGPTYTWRDVAAIRYEEGLVPSRYRRLEEDRPNAAAERFLSRVLRHRTEQDGNVLLVDVSSAVPGRVLAHEVAGYPKNMLVAEQLWEFRDRGPFDFVTGPLIPCVAAHARAPEVLAESLVYHLELLRETGDDASWFFGGVGNHDSVPCPKGWQRPLMTLFCLLPRSVPFVYSGTEFGCEIPTNEEFGDPGGDLRSPEEHLLLFSQRPVPVESKDLMRFASFWKDLICLRRALGVAQMSVSDIGAVGRDGSLVSVEIGDVLVVINCSPSRGVRLDRALTSRVRGTTAIATSAVGMSAAGPNLGPRTTALFLAAESIESSGSSFFSSRVGDAAQVKGDAYCEERRPSVPI